ncbi:MAG: AAA family ATPase [Bacteroidaceae bacterium]|nr:AAA family ATPase [Bacteroidaceae bacterium]
MDNKSRKNNTTDENTMTNFEQANSDGTPYTILSILPDDDENDDNDSTLLAGKYKKHNEMTNFDDELRDDFDFGDELGDDFEDGDFGNDNNGEDDEDEDEDEDLLSFIKDMCDEHDKKIDEEKEMMKGLTLQKLGKKEFMLPEKGAPIIACSDITLRLNNTAVKAVGQPLSIKKIEENDTFVFNLNNSIKLTGGDCYLYVYSCNFYTDNTLKYKARFTYNNTTESYSAEVPSSCFHSGIYFVLFDRVTSKDKQFSRFGNSICFPIYVCQEDDYEELYVQITSTNCKIDCTRTKLSFKVKFKYRMLNETGLNLDIYNENLNRVASTSDTAWNCNYRYERQVFEFEAISNMPLKGRYFAILTINGTPTYSLYFDVDKDGLTTWSSTFTRISLIDKHFATRIDECYYWKRLDSIYGYGNAKRCLLQMDMRNLFNKIRNGKGLSGINVNLNMIYHGGSSKEELEMLHKLQIALEKISNVQEGDCITLCEAKAAYDPYEEATNLFTESGGRGILLYNLTSLMNGNSVVVNKLLCTLKKDEFHSVCLIGSKSEIEQLFQTYPQLSEYFPRENTIERYSFTAEDYLRQCAATLQECDLYLTYEAREKLVDAIEKAFADGHLFGWTLSNAEKFTHRHIIENYYARQLKNLDEKKQQSRIEFATVEACDINTASLCSKSASPFEESIQQLNAMVGLQDIKSSITTTFNRIKVNEERKRLGLKVKDGTCNHMIFTGNPGTGKTTVAKMVGKIYHSLGLLSKGDVICADRSKIVGRYIGETERNMQRLLSEAKGNVLFIDEAYTLCDTLEDRKDFGYRAIECLLTVLSQKDSDIIVIFAGYEKDIERMMESNQGLSGRFPYKFNFKDYTAKELTEIALDLIKEEEYILTPEAEELLRTTIADTVRNKTKSFSNARWVEQYVNNGIKHAQSDRLAQMNCVPSVEVYRRIEAEDVRIAFEQHKPKEELRQQSIGFRA